LSEWENNFKLDCAVTGQGRIFEISTVGPSCGGTISPSFFTPTDTPLEWGSFGLSSNHHHPRKSACNNRSRAQAPPGSTQAAVLKKEHSRNQPFIQRDEDASTRTNKHKNVGFQRQHVFLISPNAALSESTGRKENRRKAQRLLPISTSTPPLDPQTRSHKQRVQSIQSQKWAGEPKQESEGRGE